MRSLGAPVAILAVCLLAGCGGDENGSSEPPGWTHDQADTTSGPAGWGDLDASFEQCGNGTSQSPIDIAGPAPRSLPPLRFDYREAPLRVENTGHTVEVAVPEEPAGTLTVGEDVYRLAQYHLHAPSEHLLEGKRYALEVHLVHEDDDGRLAVVGVLLRHGQPSNPVVDAMVANAPETAGQETDVGRPTSPAGLLPTSGLGYYTYPGSLTTPPCDEDVRWIVLEETLEVSPQTTRRLHELISRFPGYGGYENNNRPAQPLNGRTVTRSGTG